MIKQEGNFGEDIQNQNQKQMKTQFGSFILNKHETAIYHSFRQFFVQ